MEIGIFNVKQIFMGKKMIQYENIQNILNVPIFQKTVSLVFGKKSDEVSVTVTTSGYMCIWFSGFN